MSDVAHPYDFAAIEARWQEYWESHATFRTPNPGDEGFDPARPKFYALAMFPYPSGAGMHMGHALNYTSTDIPARYRRMRGYNVLHPTGYDAFGLPAEQYAIETGTHPAVTTQRNIDSITAQFKKLGISFDWSRCFSTTDPDYYRWTQWIYLQLYHSYFDPVEQKAKPIAHLVKRLQSGELDVDLDNQPVSVAASGAMDILGGATGVTVKWHELSAPEQRNFLDSNRLAYMADVEVNWCPALGTVLANEEVTNEGRSERGNHPVFKRPLRQWMLRITTYADRLIRDLDLIDWPESLKLLQRNWIGRSEGAVVDFAVADRDDLPGVTVFTTRPDTLFGATYMVLAPEHALVAEIATSEQKNAVNAYVTLASSRSSDDRAAETKEKTGVFTGAFAVNPVNHQRIPIWIADYVMMGYGTGAIMAVPAHDQRDYEFATKFKLPIVEVVSGGDISQAAFSEDGVNVNSANSEVSLNGLPTPEAKKKITDWLARKGLGRARVQYKLRDWLFSRQRYWGEPFPILHGPNGEIRAVDEADLPVELPSMEDFSPRPSDDPDAPPQPPLGRAPGSWKHVALDGVQYTREFNTMPQWAGSCWYYLRFADAHNAGRFVGAEAERYWMTSRKKDGSHHAGGVDLYIGGVEHAVLHLLYARFWHKALYDLGHVSTPEPFGKLFNQGYIQAHYYEDSRGVRVPADQVVQRDGKFFHQDQPVTQFFGKMGKSLKNSIAPDDVIVQYGADTLRLFLMYLGPLEQSKLWSPQDIIGIHRFLNRLWRNFIDESTGKLRVTDAPPDENQLRWLHRTIQRVTDDMDGLRFNTAIAALIELNNELTRANAPPPRQLAEVMVKLLAPLAPHLAEELWQRLGHEPSVADVAWPTYDPKYLVQDTIELPVQVLGKLRSRITVAADADEGAIRQTALADEKIQPYVVGKTVRKVIIVPGKMVNIVVG